jgi:hypothetical protein
LNFVCSFLPVFFLSHVLIYQPYLEITPFQSSYSFVQSRIYSA